MCAIKVGRLLKFPLGKIICIVVCVLWPMLTVLAVTPVGFMTKCHVNVPNAVKGFWHGF